MIGACQSFLLPGSLKQSSGLGARTAEALAEHQESNEGPFAGLSDPLASSLLLTNLQPLCPPAASLKSCSFYFYSFSVSGIFFLLPVPHMVVSVPFQCEGRLLRDSLLSFTRTAHCEFSSYHIPWWVVTSYISLCLWVSGLAMGCQGMIVTPSRRYGASGLHVRVHT